MITLSETREVNKAMRAKDDSHLWPICGKFNVTERAIRRGQIFSRYNGAFDSKYEYEMYLESVMSEIVNDPKNQ